MLRKGALLSAILRKECFPRSVHGKDPSRNDQTRREQGRHGSGGRRCPGGNQWSPSRSHIQLRRLSRPPAGRDRDRERKLGSSSRSRLGQAPSPFQRGRWYTSVMGPACYEVSFRGCPGGASPRPDAPRARPRRGHGRRTARASNSGTGDSARGLPGLAWPMGRREYRAIAGTASRGTCEKPALKVFDPRHAPHVG